MSSNNTEYVLIEATKDGFAAQFGLNIRTEYDEGEKLYHAYCDRFGLSDYADNQTAALDGITEVIQSFIESALERGNLHNVLTEAGFKRHDPTPYHHIYNRKIRSKVHDYIRETFKIKAVVKEETLASI